MFHLRIVLNYPKDLSMKFQKEHQRRKLKGSFFRHIIINEPEVVVHQGVIDSGSMLVKNRESFCFLYRRYLDENTYVVVNTTDGMESEGKEVDGTVRMRVHEHVTVWRKLGDDKTQLQLLIHSDPCGKVPAAIYNSALKKQLKYCKVVKGDVESLYTKK
eukprot:gnl/Chilomastix_caulleri/1018.p1 GENE.gnl/Chilomastix_caulleri/1018~~gnl/Chilomastix_caulleri/1018.p1  ORF type:complete len:159 (+),score=26.05 gnl/Chilomastix_caulleri/1018:52-528(+)